MTNHEINDNHRFKSRCVLNFNSIDPETPVFRVFPIERLIELFKLKKNTLVKPILWDDPFENVIFQQSAEMKNGQKVSFSSIREKYYGQCWTLNINESDALWRIYSPAKTGVRIKTTFGKLWDSYYNPSDKWALISYFIGKIIYANVKEIQDFFEDPKNLEMIFDTSAAGAVQTLLIKRIEFEHENEIRLIFAGNTDNTKKIFQYAVEPNHLIDEILFDPRFDDENDFQSRKKEIESFGFTGKIEKSNLYQLPNFRLFLNR